MIMVLPGIDVVSTDETCLAPDGVGWPCGMAARTAFRAYLRGRSINCRLPDVPSEKSMLTDCLLQGEDPALWLVKNGWARAKSDCQFLSEGQIAKEATRGIFGYPQR